MESDEWIVSFDNGHFVLIGEGGKWRYILDAGDVIELRIQGSYQPVLVESGGYCGWYYELADGSRARFAVSMRGRPLPLSRRLMTH